MAVKYKWMLRGVVLLAVAAAGVGVAMAATMSSKSGTVRAAHNGKYGSLLVSAAGMTLYHYTPDKHGTSSAPRPVRSSGRRSSSLAARSRRPARASARRSSRP